MGNGDISQCTFSSAERWTILCVIPVCACCVFSSLRIRSLREREGIFVSAAGEDSMHRKPSLPKDYSSVLTYLEKAHFGNALDFHQAVRAAVLKLKDSHINFRPPYALVSSLCLPVVFGSQLLGNSSVGLHQGIFVSRMAPFAQDIPVDAGKIASLQAAVGSSVQSVNGLKPFMVLEVRDYGYKICLQRLHEIYSVGKAGNTYPVSYCVPMPDVGAHVHHFLVQ